MATRASGKAEVAPAPSSSLPVTDRIIELYDGVPAGSEHWSFVERTVFNPEAGVEFTQNVVRPTLLYFAANPEKANGTAVIIAPGGGGVNLTIHVEGTAIAQQLSQAGVAAFVLKYRLVGHPSDSLLSKAYATDGRGIVTAGPQQGQDIRPLAIADGGRAVEWLRGHAKEFGLQPDQIGFVGFSAGGFVGGNLISGPIESRPDFIAFMYGADPAVQPGSEAPPAFLACAFDDPFALDGTLTLFHAWRTARRPAEIHVFQTGGHGFTVKGGGGDRVLDRLTEWMNANGWLKKNPR